MEINYKINFDATNSKGDIVANITFEVGPFYPEEKPINRSVLALQRLCVEYARLIGIKCSFADIISIQKSVEK